MQLHPAQYLGQEFPTTDQTSTGDYAVLRIFDEESDARWRPGFYRFDADVMQIEQAVQACTAKPSQPASGIGPKLVGVRSKITFKSVSAT